MSVWCLDHLYYWHFHCLIVMERRGLIVMSDPIVVNFIKYNKKCRDSTAVPRQNFPSSNFPQSGCCWLTWRLLKLTSSPMFRREQRTLGPADEGYIEHWIKALECLLSGSCTTCPGTGGGSLTTDGGFSLPGRGLTAAPPPAASTLTSGRAASSPSSLLSPLTSLSLSGTKRRKVSRRETGRPTYRARTSSCSSISQTSPDQRGLMMETWRRPTGTISTCRSLSTRGRTVEGRHPVGLVFPPSVLSKLHVISGWKPRGNEAQQTKYKSINQQGNKLEENLKKLTGD